jgi:hypothetical protein
MVDTETRAITDLRSDITSWTELPEGPTIGEILVFERGVPVDQVAKATKLYLGGIAANQNIAPGLRHHIEYLIGQIKEGE